MNASPECYRDQSVPARQHLELVAVHDRQVGVDADRTRGRGVQAEEAAALLPRREDSLVADLELAENGVVRGQLHLAERPVRPRCHDDLVLACRIHVDERDSGRIGGRRERELDARRAQPGERLLDDVVPADGAELVVVCPAAGPRHRLVRALAARNA